MGSTPSADLRCGIWFSEDLRLSKPARSCFGVSLPPSVLTAVTESFEEVTEHLDGSGSPVEGVGTRPEDHK